MRPYQRDFIDLALSCEALCFGQFTLKSGRKSSYFFNSGRFASGSALSRVGQAYAEAFCDAGIEADVLFGAAYKGIALVSAMVMALHERHGRDLPWAYNRKEAKTHGEAGVLVGAPVSGRRVLIVDDVLTAGTAVRETLELIRTYGAEPAGVLVALDRQERGQGELLATQEVTRDFGIPVCAIVQIDEVLACTASVS